MEFQTGDIILASLQSVWVSVTSLLPSLIGAFLVFVLGWIVAVALGKLVEEVVRSLKVDRLIAKLEVEQVFERAGWKLNTGAFLGGLIKWFLIVVFLLASVNILGLTQVSSFLRDVLLYVPNVIIAAVILIITAFVSQTVENVVRGGVEAVGYRGSLVGVVTRWSIWVFALIAVLLQLGIAVALIQTVVTGFIAAMALAFGLAFGLGGKDAAADFIQRVRGELRR
jgi:hypothetical protein